MNSVDISEPQDFKHIFHYPNSGMDDSNEDTKKYVKVRLTIASRIWWNSYEFIINF